MSKGKSLTELGVADLVTMDIKVDGKVIDATYEVMSVHVMRELNRIPTARIVLLDGDPATETFGLSEGNDFVPGKEIEILAGYNSKDKTLFKGIIVKHGLKMRSSGSPVLVTQLENSSRSSAASCHFG